MATTKKCPNCGNVNPANEAKCLNCGADLPQEPNFVQKLLSRLTGGTTVTDEELEQELHETFRQRDEAQQRAFVAFRNEINQRLAEIYQDLSHQIAALPANQPADLTTINSRLDELQTRLGEYPSAVDVHSAVHQANAHEDRLNALAPITEPGGPPPTFVEAMTHAATQPSPSTPPAPTQEQKSWLRGVIDGLFNSPNQS